jgi:hypothetical protein
MVRKSGRKFQSVVMRRAPIFKEYVSDDLLELGLIQGSTRSLGIATQRTFLPALPAQLKAMVAGARYIRQKQAIDAIFAFGA